MSKKIIKCPICKEKFTTASGLYDHVSEDHPEDIPESYSPARYLYYVRTGKTSSKCVECGRPTEWKESTGKYARYCPDPRCKENYIKKFESRMIGVHGKARILDDPNQQRKMLQSRKISGVYTWSDGAKKSYTGTYELDALKFLDNFMNFSSDDVFTPSPHTYYYEYEGEKKFYIPDMFIASLNLEIEIKDGGNNPNMHHKIQDVDKVKEKLKDNVMNSQGEFDYIKLVNKTYSPLLEYLYNRKIEVMGNNKMKEDNNGQTGSIISESYLVESSNSTKINNVKTIRDVNPNDYPDGFYYANRWNAIKWDSTGNPIRDAVEVLVIKDDTYIYLDKGKGRYEYDEYYRVPGGSKDINKSDDNQARNEVEEEAGIILKDLYKTRYTRRVEYRQSCEDVDIDKEGLSYKDFLGKFYTGKMSDIYIGTYKGNSSRYIPKIDRDASMKNHGGFYPIKDVWDILYEDHRNALVEYGYDKFPVDESAVDAQDILIQPLSSTNIEDFVFVVLSNNKGTAPNFIKSFTGQEYSHAAISFDLTMNHLYSFGGVPMAKTSAFNGFIRESIYSPTYANNNYFTIFAVQVKDKQALSKMRQSIDRMVGDLKNYTYSTIGLFRYAFKEISSTLKNIEDRHSFFCSEFVSSMMSLAQGIDYNRFSSPGDLEKFPGVIRIGTYDIDTYEYKIGVNDFDKTLRIHKKYQKAVSKEGAAYVNIGNIVSDTINYFITKWQDKDMRNITALIDWKMLKDKFENNFGIYDKRVRFDVIEVIIRSAIFPIARVGIKDYTFSIIDWMDILRKYVRTNKITIIGGNMYNVIGVSSDGSKLYLKLDSKSKSVQIV